MPWQLTQGWVHSGVKKIKNSFINKKSFMYVLNMWNCTHIILFIFHFFGQQFFFYRNNFLTIRSTMRSTLGGKFIPVCHSFVLFAAIASTKRPFTIPPLTHLCIWTHTCDLIEFILFICCFWRICVVHSLTYFSILFFVCYF